jgi:very-short-patch-repair endonuclease
MTALASRFWQKWQAIPGAPTLIKEYRFDSVRQWRFDFAHPQSRVAVEMEDGLWLKGGDEHTRRIAYEKDLEKYAGATFQGWILIRLHQRQTTYDTLVALQWLIESRSSRIT